MLASGEYAFTPPENLFLLNRGNWNFVSGKSRRLAGANNCLFIAICVLVLGCLLTIAGNNLLTAYLVGQSGRSASALIVSRRVSSGKSTSYYVTFKFSPTVGDLQGKPVSVEQSVSRDTYNRLTTGSEVSISYVPDSPDRALLTGSAADNSVITSTVLVSIAICIGLVFLIRILFRGWRRDARLAQAGQLIWGQLTSYHPRRGSKGTFFVDISCTFQSPTDGQYLTGKGSAQRGDLRGKPSPPIGSPVAILYVDDNLFRIL